MSSLRYTARAIITLIVIFLLVLLLGGFAFITGVFYPSRAVMNRCSVLWSRAILFCSGVRPTIRGCEYIADGIPRFFMGNHQSALDIPILICVLKGNVRFLAKDSLFRIPLFGWVIRRYGYLPVDRANARRTLKTVGGAIDGLRRNPICLAAFPEGTRSRDGKLLPFRRGTMKFAQQAGLPLVPFAIEGTIDVLNSRRFLRIVPGPVTLSFCEPIASEDVVAMEPAALLERVASTVAGELRQRAPGAVSEDEIVAEPVSMSTAS